MLTVVCHSDASTLVEISSSSARVRNWEGDVLLVPDTVDSEPANQIAWKGNDRSEARPPATQAHAGDAGSKLERKSQVVGKHSALTGMRLYVQGVSLLVEPYLADFVA